MANVNIVDDGFVEVGSDEMRKERMQGVKTNVKSLQNFFTTFDKLTKAVEDVTKTHSELTIAYKNYDSQKATNSSKSKQDQEKLENMEDCLDEALQLFDLGVKETYKKLAEFPDPRRTTRKIQKRMENVKEQLKQSGYMDDIVNHFMDFGTLPDGFDTSHFSNLNELIENAKEMATKPLDDSSQDVDVDTVELKDEIATIEDESVDQNVTKRPPLAPILMMSFLNNCFDSMKSELVSDDPKNSLAEEARQNQKQSTPLTCPYYGTVTNHPQEATPNESNEKHNYGSLDIFTEYQVEVEAGELLGLTVHPIHNRTGYYTYLIEKVDEDELMAKNIDPKKIIMQEIVTVNKTYVKNKDRDSFFKLISDVCAQGGSLMLGVLHEPVVEEKAEELNPEKEYAMEEPQESLACSQTTNSIRELMEKYFKTEPNTTAPEDEKPVSDQNERNLVEEDDDSADESVTGSENSSSSDEEYDIILAKYDARMARNAAIAVADEPDTLQNDEVVLETENDSSQPRNEEKLELETQQTQTINSEERNLTSDLEPPAVFQIDLSNLKYEDSLQEEGQLSDSDDESISDESDSSSTDSDSSDFSDSSDSSDDDSSEELDSTDCSEIPDLVSESDSSDSEEDENKTEVNCETRAALEKIIEVRMAEKGNRRNEELLFAVESSKAEQVVPTTTSASLTEPTVDPALESTDFVDTLADFDWKSLVQKIFEDEARGYRPKLLRRKTEKIDMPELVAEDTVESVTEPVIEDNAPIKAVVTEATDDVAIEENPVVVKEEKTPVTMNNEVIATENGFTLIEILIILAVIVNMIVFCMF